MMNVMNAKCKFTIDEVINLAENCYSVGSANWLRAQFEDYVTVDDESLCDSLGVTRQDVADLCVLRDIGFENVRWVKDIFEEFGGCWIAEKIEHEVDGDKHGGMLVCLSVRVGRMLDEYCKKESKNENDRIRNKVEDLMYDLLDSLNKWNGNNMRNVNRIILVLEDLENIFKRIRDKQIER